jgi:hypothetical protein
VKTLLNRKLFSYAAKIHVGDNVLELNVESDDAGAAASGYIEQRRLEMTQRSSLSQILQQKTEGLCLPLSQLLRGEAFIPNVKRGRVITISSWPGEPGEDDSACRSAENNSSSR